MGRASRRRRSGPPAGPPPPGWDRPVLLHRRDLWIVVAALLIALAVIARGVPVRALALALGEEVPGLIVGAGEWRSLKGRGAPVVTVRFADPQGGWRTETFFAGPALRDRAARGPIPAPLRRLRLAPAIVGLVDDGGYTRGALALCGAIVAGLAAIALMAHALRLRRWARRQGAPGQGAGRP